jgi:uncharacterized protein YecT (DUF1311 family)
MKIHPPVLGVLIAVLGAAPAFAMDCRKASSALEHAICADPVLLAADASMSTAYGRLLHGVTDPDIRDALINSQRRWVAAREYDLGSRGAASDAPDRAALRQVLLDAARAREKDLTAQVRGASAYITKALNQRRRFAAYTGGPFNGYRGQCSFIPDRQNPNVYSYDCFGSLSVQNGGRVCRDDQDFATYSSVEHRMVANIVEGRLKAVAICVINAGGDSQCPDSNDPGEGKGWNLHPGPQQASIADDAVPMTKLDPELSALDGEDQDWLKSCLTERNFPAPDHGAP